MSFEDKTLQCSDCGATFTFPATEQEFFHSKGYIHDPKRCPGCRSARKERQAKQGFGDGGGSGYQTQRQMFPATCAQCGKATEVPFEPRLGRPVYCSDCYRKVKPAR